MSTDKRPVHYVWWLMSVAMLMQMAQNMIYGDDRGYFWYLFFCVFVFFSSVFVLAIIEEIRKKLK